MNHIPLTGGDVVRLLAKADPGNNPGEIQPLPRNQLWEQSSVMGCGWANKTSTPRSSWCARTSAHVPYSGCYQLTWNQDGVLSTSGPPRVRTGKLTSCSMSTRTPSSVFLQDVGLKRDGQMTLCTFPAPPPVMRVRLVRWLGCCLIYSFRLFASPLGSRDTGMAGGRGLLHLGCLCPPVSARRERSKLGS